MTTVRLTVGQALVRFMAAQYSVRDGVRRRLIPGVWAILGHGNVAGLGQALHELGPEAGLRSWRGQNEQAMVHAAAAFAKHTDRLQLQAVTASIGPGSLNMVTAAAGATVNRLPVLLLPSDYFANRAPDPVLQQLEQPHSHELTVNEAFRPVSRFFARIERPEQLPSALLAALRVLTDPADTGAVTISLPEDVQAEAFDWPASLFNERDWHIRRQPADEESLAQAAELLKKAQRPVLIAGGGAIYSGASLELAAFAEKYGLPVVETQAGKGVLPWNHPLNAGPVGANGGSAANTLAAEADLVLAVGTRLGDFVTGSRTAFQRDDVRVIGLNVAAMDAFKLGAAPLIADARTGLEQLRALLGEERQPDGDYLAEVSSLKREWDGTVDELRRMEGKGALAQSAVIGMVNDSFGGHATVINAAGSMPGDLLKLWRPEDPKAYHLEYGFSCMGYEIPAGIGVKLAEPEREVVVFIGDGSYLMMNSEIVTAVTEGMNLTIVLVDNHGYQSIHGLQRSTGTPGFLNELRMRAEETDQLDGPYLTLDLAAHARALGAHSFFVDDAEALRSALEGAPGLDGVRVIVVRTDPEKRVPSYGGWWDVPVAEVSGRKEVRAARREYEKSRSRQKVML